VSADTLAVVVRWRGGDEVRACVASLLAHGGPRLARVVLVDSGSGDGGAERLATEFPTVQVMALEENRSFAHAANRGAAAGGERRLLLLNPDAELLPGSLDELGTGLDRRPDSAGAVPLLEGADGASQHRWQLRRLPGPLRLATGRSGAPAFTAPPTADQPVAQPAAAAWLIRRSVWQSLGGFDEVFAPAWWEDVDFCARLDSRRGTRSFPVAEGFVVHPGARILHHGGSSMASLGDEAFLTAYFRNLTRYIARHHPQHAPAILNCLRLTLKIRAVAQPSRRNAFRAALTSLDREIKR
jgi:N-acetylglucosaminyl-diphospho-decaprenol L-rhamnosyltransferase